MRDITREIILETKNTGLYLRILSDNMNTCIHVSFECVWEEIEASIRSDLSGEAGDFISDYSLLKESENTLVLLCNMQSFEAFVDFIHRPGLQEAYSIMGVKLKVYSMKLIERG